MRLSKSRATRVNWINGFLMLGWTFDPNGPINGRWSYNCNDLTCCRFFVFHLNTLHLQSRRFLFPLGFLSSRLSRRNTCKHTLRLGWWNRLLGDSKPNHKSLILTFNYLHEDIYEYENIDDKNYFIFVNNYFKQKKKNSPKTHWQTYLITRIILFIEKICVRISNSSKRYKQV